MARPKDKIVREIIEADVIKRSGADCVSVASIDLIDKDVAFLRAAVRLVGMAKSTMIAVHFPINDD